MHYLIFLPLIFVILEVKIKIVRVKALRKPTIRKQRQGSRAGSFADRPTPGIRFGRCLTPPDPAHAAPAHPPPPPGRPRAASASATIRAESSVCVCVGPSAAACAASASSSAASAEPGSPASRCSRAKWLRNRAMRECAAPRPVREPSPGTRKGSRQMNLTPRISYDRSPPGAGTEIVSPTFLPIRAFASGAEIDSRAALMSASCTPTI